MQKKNKRWLADINVKHLHKEYLLLMSVRLNERKGYWNVFYCNFSQHHEEGKYWGSKSDYSLLCLKGTEGFLFRFNHSLQYPFQQKDLLWQILCQGKSRGVYVTVLADTSIWKVCALVDFPLSSCYKRTSLFSTPGQGPTGIVTRFNTSAIQSLRRFIQSVPRLLLLIKKIIFVFPAAQ